MNLIAELTDALLFPDNPAPAPQRYDERTSARAVVFNDAGQIALLYLQAHAAYKLPGGGTEGTETPEQTLNREMLEEIGTAVTGLQHLGITVEYRNQANLKHTSHCFLARQTGELQEVSPTEEEISFQARPVWVDSLEIALELVRDTAPVDYASAFIRQRDLEILEEAYKMLGRP